MHFHARTFVTAAGASLALFGVAVAATPNEMALSRITGAASSLPVDHLSARGTNAAGRLSYGDIAMPIAPIGIALPFGPYARASEGTVDAFNLGVDLSALPGSEVRAMADGEVFLAAGPVVILRHVADADIPFQGRAVRRWYSLYSPVESDVVFAPFTRLAKGDKLGTLPPSATALHVETLVGSATGDARVTAAVSPMRFLPYVKSAPLSARVTSVDPLTIAVSVDATAPDLEEIRIKQGKKIIALHLSAREGFTTTESGEIVANVAKIRMSRPAEGAVLEYEFTFDGVSAFDNILVRDVWGGGVSLHP